MLKPYDEYKTVDEVWVEKVPQHWEFKRLKHIFYNRVEKNSPIKTECVLSLSARNGVELQTEKIDKGGNKPKSDFSKYNIAYEQDLLVNCMNVVSGSSGVSNWYGAISPVYYALHTRNQNSNIRYYHYLFRFKPFYRSLLRFSKGILMHESDNGNLNTVRMRISMESLNNINIPIPPREEQDQIVKYLDWQISKINTLIKAKKKQIELLKEQKQGVINKAVTKGLDDNVPMKDSGVEWLSEVPEHWEVNRLKRFCKVNASISNLTKAYSDNDKLVFLPMESVTVDGKIDCSLKRPFKEIKSGYSSFAKHDVIIAKITPCFENGKGACLDGLETEIGYGTTELITIRGYNNILPKYLYLVTITQQFRLNGEEGMTGSAGQKRIPTNFVANFIQGIPPLEEQQAIVTYLEEKTALIDKAIAVIGKEIELVSEYKISLISSVTTGKVDVRDVVVPEFEVVEDEVSDMVEELEADMHDSD